MKENKKIIRIHFFIIILLLLLLCILALKEKFTYCIVVVSILFIGIINIIRLYYFSKKGEEELYNKVLRTILNTYEEVLVDIDKIPEINPKNIINVLSFEKMIDIQVERKKPILYKLSINSCLFLIIDESEVYIYVLRMKEDSYSPLDDIINSIEQNTKKEQEDKLLLENIDKTTIIKLDNLKEYKISPIKEKEISSVAEEQFLVKLKKDYLNTKK